MAVMDKIRQPIVATVTPVDVDQTIAVLALAFIADPVARWVYPDPEQYLRLFPPFLRAFGGRAFAQGTARRVSGHAGAALWLPPGIEPHHEAIDATLPPGRHEIGALFEEMASYHPHEAHWYLPLIGVDPAHQRNGFGAALLRDTLRQCDSDHAVAYLESTSPASVPLYKRHGFEVVGTIRVGSSPPMFPMRRAAR
jgi:GNAT superfamily N-acetyltransferase